MDLIPSSRRIKLEILDGGLLEEGDEKDSLIQLIHLVGLFIRGV